MKKAWFLAGIIYLSMGLVNAQTTQNEEIATASEQNSVDTQIIYSNVDSEARFENGIMGLSLYLAKSVKYPEAATKDSIEGRVNVSFVVERDGRLSNIKVSRSLHPACDAQAIEVVKNMPNWQPALVDGQAVRYKHTISIGYYNINK